jgi:hypothetical protein
MIIIIKNQIIKINREENLQFLLDKVRNGRKINKIYLIVEIKMLRKKIIVDIGRKLECQ